MDDSQSDSDEPSEPPRRPDSGIHGTDEDADSDAPSDLDMADFTDFDEDGEDMVEPMVLRPSESDGLIDVGEIEPDEWEPEDYLVARVVLKVEDADMAAYRCTLAQTVPLALLQALHVPVDCCLLDPCKLCCVRSSADCTWCAMRHLQMNAA